MEHAQRLTLVEMREFVASSGSLSFTGAGRKEIYGLVFPELSLVTQPFEDLGHRQPDFGEQLIDQAGDKKRDPLAHRAASWRDVSHCSAGEERPAPSSSAARSGPKWQRGTIP